VKPSRPQSAKPRRNSIKPLENCSEKEFSTCLNHIAKKYPDYDKLIKIEKNDLENFFYTKVKEFKNLLEDNLGNVRFYIDCKPDKRETKTEK
jgi:hypothetical protein